MSAIQQTISFEMRDGKNETIAHVRIFNDAGVFWITDLWVAPDHRRKGYARQLMRAALDDQGYRTMYLKVAPYTDQPIDADDLTFLYRGYGFKLTEVPGVMKREGVDRGL